MLEENRRARAFYEQAGFRPDGAKIPVNIGGKELTELRYLFKILNPWYNIRKAAMPLRGKTGAREEELKAIVYTSNTGYTKHYAELLSAETACRPMTCGTPAASWLRARKSSTWAGSWRAASRTIGRRPRGIPSGLSAPWAWPSPRKSTPRDQGT